MPFATTLRAHTTVHANRDLLETEETAAKVKLLLSSSFSLSLSSPLESFTASFSSPSFEVLFESQIGKHFEKGFSLVEKVSAKFHTEQNR